MPAGLRAAVAFLTILPVGRGAPASLAGAHRWYATVGLLLGSILVLADRLLRGLLPEPVAALCLLVLWVGLSGALHWDGLLDCLDALLAPQPVERRLEILRDVHSGSFAVVGGALALMLAATLLGTLPPERRGWALLLAPVLGRWLMGWAQQQWPYARAGGLGRLTGRASSRGALLLHGWPLLLALPGGAPVLLPLLGATLVTALLARWMAGRLGGGLTGDCYGALCELSQIAVLLGFAVGA